MEKDDIGIPKIATTLDQHLIMELSHLNHDPVCYRIRVILDFLLNLTIFVISSFLSVPQTISVI